VDSASTNVHPAEPRSELYTAVCRDHDRISPVSEIGRTCGFVSCEGHSLQMCGAGQGTMKVPRAWWLDCIGPLGDQHRLHPID
jgi:hypothetical protein